ncbi:hypothetical protein BDZ97DRAFT_1887667, partial [Flammula alnicola]
TNHLPRSQKLSPRLNSWPETRAVMMPPKKTRAKRAGDKAYGAGERSGKKAKTGASATADSADVQPQGLGITEVTIPAPAHTLPMSNIPVDAPSTLPQPTSSYYRPKTYVY